MSRPLTGLSVVEGSAFVAVPSGGMTLAQLGADVIRFDRIEGGLDYRRWPLAASGTSLYWNGLNRGKRSIVADLTDPEVQELLAELIAKAGNFLTNFPARGWLAYDHLKRNCDDLVMIAVTGSPDGTSAVDYTINCAVGYPAITGHPDDARPVNHSLPAWDLICGQTAALGILAADRHRSRTGEGQLVGLALADVAMAAVAWRGELTDAELNGIDREPLGNDLYGSFGRDFPTADGRRVMVVAITPRQWQGLRSATRTAADVDELAEELGLDLDDEGARFVARDRLSGILAPWFAERTLAEVSTALADEAVCWGTYRTFRQMLAEDPRCSQENPMFTEIDQPGVGVHLVPGSPLAFGGPESADRGAGTAPRLGEHSEAILANDLGLSATEIASLVDRGAVLLNS